jgi:hypothetical protein
VSAKPDLLTEVAQLRDDLGKLRDDPGISQKFADWHGRLVACLALVSDEFPGCAHECRELRAIDFELPPEIEASIPKGLPRHRIMPAASQMYFRNKCDEVDELLKTLAIALKQSEP